MSNNFVKLYTVKFQKTFTICRALSVIRTNIRKRLNRRSDGLCTLSEIKIKVSLNVGIMASRPNSEIEWIKDISGEGQSSTNFGSSTWILHTTFVLLGHLNHPRHFVNMYPLAITYYCWWCKRSVAIETADRFVKLADIKGNYSVQ